jgi:hypothetical protein
MKEWAAKTREQIVAHNKELEPIRQEVLMSVQDMIKKATAAKKEKIK